MKLRNLIPAAILSALSLSAFAGRGNAVGLVKNVSVHLNNWQSTNVNQTGLLFIEMAELPGNLCSHSRAALPTNHPLYDSVLKMALEAQEQGPSIT